MWNRMERVPMKKGFIFTTDAFVALTLISMVVIVIIYQLNIASALFPQQMQAHDFATDIMVTFSTLKMGEVTTGYPTLPQDMENSVLEQISKEALRDTDEGDAAAALIAQQLLIMGDKPMLPAQFGASIFVLNRDTGNWEEVKVRAAPYTRVQSSASYVLLGYSPDDQRNIYGTYSTPPYDYPPGESSTDYCSREQADTVVFPCEAQSVYDAGALMEPTFVRVVVWV